MNCAQQEPRGVVAIGAGLGRAARYEQADNVDRSGQRLSRRWSLARPRPPVPRPLSPGIAQLPRWGWGILRRSLGGEFHTIADTCSDSPTRSWPASGRGSRSDHAPATEGRRAGPCSQTSRAALAGPAASPPAGSPGPPAGSGGSDPPEPPRPGPSGRLRRPPRRLRPPPPHAGGAPKGGVDQSPQAPRPRRGRIAK